MPLTYPAIMALAVGTSALISRHTKSRLALSRRERAAILLGAYCGSMIGAKLPYVLLDWRGLVTGTAWLDNGKTILAGLVGGYAGVEIAKWACGIRVKTGDGFAVPVAVGIGIGRWACFFGGCCYGVATSLPWGVDFGDGIRRHPTQLYESAFHLSFAALLFWLQKRGKFRGQLVKLYILGYLAYRFITETIRPEPRIFLSLTPYQWGALLLAPLFGYLWMRDARVASVTAT